MKKCPYCAEEIQDEAILCRYCHSDLSVPVPTGAARVFTRGSESETGVRPSTATEPVSSAGSRTEAAASSQGQPPDSRSPFEDLSQEPGEQEGKPAASSPPGFGGQFGFGGQTAPSEPETDTASSAATAEEDREPGPTPPTEHATEPERGTQPMAEPVAAPQAGQETEPAAESGAVVAVEPVAQPSAAPAQAVAAPVTYTHSGHRYVLGFGPDFFGIWDRQQPNDPVERFPRTDDGWRQAWTKYAGMEPSNVEVGQQSQAGHPSATPQSASPQQTSSPQGPSTTAGGEAMQYTHSGQRFLLGYGADFFGIWDRNELSSPAQRFPRTDEGWRAAWQQFSAWEPHSAEVGLGGKS